MPRGDKSSYTNKQKRQAAHIEEAYLERGRARGFRPKLAPGQPSIR